MVYDPPIPSFGCGHNNCASPHLNLTPPLAVTDDGHQQIYRMYHIYNRNLFVCVIPSIASVGLFGESVFTRVFRSPSVIAELWFRSRRLWNSTPISRSHSTVLPTGSQQVDCMLVLSLSIASPSIPRGSSGNDAHPRISVIAFSSRVSVRGSDGEDV